MSCSFETPKCQLSPACFYDSVSPDTCIKNMTEYEIQKARADAARFAAAEADRIEKARADAARFAEETARRIEENRKLAESFRKS